MHINAKLEKYSKYSKTATATKSKNSFCIHKGIKKGYGQKQALPSITDNCKNIHGH
jgi:hypothetical protein